MSRVNVLELAHLSAQVLRLPRRAREDLALLLNESLGRLTGDEPPKVRKAKNPNPGIVLDTGQEIKAADDVAKKMHLRGSAGEKA